MTLVENSFLLIAGYRIPNYSIGLSFSMLHRMLVTNSHAVSSYNEAFSSMNCLSITFKKEPASLRLRP